VGALLSAIRKVGLYLNTLRYLRISQLCWQVYRRLRPVITPREIELEVVRTGIFGFATARGPQPAVYEFRFLNKSRAANPESINWHPQNESRLWRYNLHYFDFLSWDSFPADHKAAYIDSWIKNNPVGTVDAWEPYTLSLRVVNWVKFFDSMAERVPDHWAYSLINQVNWLNANLEHHILANHLLKNIKALIIAGGWFDGPHGKLYLRRGMQLLLREVDEQMLADGGHFERSPMYHSIVLEDLLDICNVLGNLESPLWSREQKAVRDAAVKGLEFLSSMVGTDNRIPLFNDSAHGIAAEPAQLFAYGARVLDYKPPAGQVGPVRIDLPDSGYFGYRCGGDSLIIDCGSIGPAYQPGHAHCDTLSYVLNIDGAPLVIDSGVRGYENDSLRQYVRSTAAHNTVRIAGEEQSEIWGTFRVARRAVATVNQFTGPDNGKLEFSGAHDGYIRLPSRCEHQRHFSVDVSGRWKIADRITGTGRVIASSFVHFHPDITLSPASDGAWQLIKNGAAVARLSVAKGSDAVESSSYYCPEFGSAIENACLEVRVSGDLPLEIGYEIVKIA
jgi:uncharacterized heparinase superfamily protein